MGPAREDFMKKIPNNKKNDSKTFWIRKGYWDDLYTLKHLNKSLNILPTPASLALPLLMAWWTHILLSSLRLPVDILEICTKVALTLSCLAYILYDLQIPLVPQVSVCVAHAHICIFFSLSNYGYSWTPMLVLELSLYYLRLSLV